MDITTASTGKNFFLVFFNLNFSQKNTKSGVMKIFFGVLTVFVGFSE